MKTTSLIATVLLSMTLTACSQKQSHETVATESSDSTNIEAVASDPSLGKMEEHTYSGLIPDSSGGKTHYSLTIRNQEYSGDGTFSLTITTPATKSEKSDTCTYSGRRYTQRGIPGDNDATVWQLKSDDGTIFNLFFNSTDSTLILLDDNFHKIAPSSAYTLHPQR